MLEPSPLRDGGEENNWLYGLKRVASVHKQHTARMCKRSDVLVSEVVSQPSTESYSTFRTTELYEGGPQSLERWRCRFMESKHVPARQNCAVHSLELGRFTCPWRLLSDQQEVFSDFFVSPDGTSGRLYKDGYRISHSVSLAASSVVLGLIIGTYFSWKMTLWMVFLTPLIAIRSVETGPKPLRLAVRRMPNSQAKRNTSSSTQSRRCRQFIPKGMPSMSSSLNNTDLGSNEALAYETKEYAKLFNNIGHQSRIWMSRTFKLCV